MTDTRIEELKQVLWRAAAQTSTWSGYEAPRCPHKPISQKRLEALPFAERCRECEETHEISTQRSRQLAQRRTGSFGCIDATSRD